MSNKSKRASVGSTYSSSKKHRTRDVSPSTDDQQDSGIDSNDRSDKKSKKKSDSSKRQKDESGDEDDEEEEEEYEVVTIKDHKHVGKVIKYLVGWKGYDSEDDSWEPEAHLEGAVELLKQYKAAHDLPTTTKSARASVGSSKSAKKAIKEADSDGSDGDEPAARKRKRLSQDKPSSTIAPLRKNGINGPTKVDRESVKNRKSAQSGSGGSDEESMDEEEWHALHKKYPDWEDFIRSVRTIEKPGVDGDSANDAPVSNNAINVCLLWKTGRTTWVTNKIARAKLPQKLLDFYEEHLQFSTAEQ